MLVGVLFCAVSMAACSSKQPPASPYREQPEPPVGSKTVHLGSGGSGTAMGPMPKREKLWTVYWQKAAITFGKDGSFSGKMEGITGETFEATKTANRFSSDFGHADKQQDVLVLEDNVKVVSLGYKATLFCDRMDYRPHKKLIRAQGHVRIEMPNGVIHAGNEVLTTPDLKQIATPEMFKP